MTNPIPTWGGADAEALGDAEKQIPRWLQHRDRLVTAEDFETIVLRTPGASVGRVDVLPAFHPDVSLDEPGDAPGTVTLMVIPRYAARSPDHPTADQPFLQAIADYIEPRRLITTEVLLRGPTYKPIYVSLGVTVSTVGAGVADVIKAVEQAVRRFLSPLPEADAAIDGTAPALFPGGARRRSGWPLRQAVHPLEIAAVVNRVEGVSWTKQVKLSDGGETDDLPIPMRRLELPLLARLAVSVGDARPMKDLLGDASPGETTGSGIAKIVPVPVVPEEC